MIPTRERCVTVDLTREQSWMLHAALVDHIDRAIDDGRTPSDAIDALKHVEGDETCLDASQRSLVRDAVVSFLDDAGARDRATGGAVLDAIDAHPA